MPDEESEDLDQISLTDELLARLAGFVQRDYYLERLIREGDIGAGSPIAVMTNGMLLFGQVGSGRDLAKALDDEWERGIKESDGELDEEDRAKAEKLIGRHVEDYDKEIGEVKKLEERAFEMDSPLDELAPDEAARWIASGAHHTLTLTKVKVAHAAALNCVTRVAVMRVRVSEIAAWWPLETDYTTGKVSYLPFEDADRVNEEEQAERKLRAA